MSGHDLISTLREHYRSGFRTLDGPKRPSASKWFSIAPEMVGATSPDRVFIPGVMHIALTSGSGIRRRAALEGAAEALLDDIPNWPKLYRSGVVERWPVATIRGALLVMGMVRTGFGLPTDLTERIIALCEHPLPDPVLHDLVVLVMSSADAGASVAEAVLQSMFLKHLELAPRHAFDLIERDWRGCGSWVSPPDLAPVFGSDDRAIRERANVVLGALRRR